MNVENLNKEEIMNIIEQKIENAKENYKAWCEKYANAIPNSDEERTIVWNKWKWAFKHEELKSLKRDIEKEEHKRKN